MMTLKWRMNNCVLPFLNSVCFIYLCLISKSPNYAAVCKIMVLLLRIKILYDNFLLRRNSTPTSFDIFLVI